MTVPPQGAESGPDWHPAVLHTCRAAGTLYASRGAIHAVLAPARPGQTPLSDIKDAGYEILAYGVFPSEVPECDHAESYPQCQHLLLRRRRG